MAAMATSGATAVQPLDRSSLVRNRAIMADATPAMAATMISASFLLKTGFPAFLETLRSTERSL